MNIIHKTNDYDRCEYGCNRIRIKSFRQVTIFKPDEMKIIYRKNGCFIIEYPNRDFDERTSIVEGGDAEQIIETIINNEIAGGATLIWSGVRYEPIDGTDVDKDYVDDEKERKEPIVNNIDLR